MERSPWTFDAILAVAAKIRSGTGPLIPAFYKCLEEAQNIALDKWWADCDELHRKHSVCAVRPSVPMHFTGQTIDEEALPRKIVVGELHYAKLWLVCVALRGVSWDKMPFEERELAFQAKDAASNCLSNLLDSPTYRTVLRYAVQDSLVMAAFSGLFLLKMAYLFPAELDLGAITVQVEQLAQLLSDVAAERYALMLRIMLANLRRKVGLAAPGFSVAGCDVSTSPRPAIVPVLSVAFDTKYWQTL